MAGVGVEGPDGRRREGQLGFALLTVLAAVAVLASFASLLAHTATIEAKTKANIALRARAEAAAEAGLNVAILRLVQWSHGGDDAALDAYRGPSGHGCVIEPDAWVTAWILDEAGKVDLNAAPAELLERLFAGLGADSRLAESVAAAIVAFRAVPSDGSAEAHGPFFTVDELDQVEAMPPWLFKAVRPLVTVHSGLAGFDPSAASPALLQSLAEAGEIPEQYLVASYGSKFAVRSVADVDPGATAAIQAIVELNPVQPNAYRLLDWQSGLAAGVDRAGHNGTRAQC